MSAGILNSSLTKSKVSSKCSSRSYRYHKLVKHVKEQISHIHFERVRRLLNGKADTLAKLAEELADPNLDKI